MPDNAGAWHKPSDLLLTDLPGEFNTTSDSAVIVSKKLGMKQPVDLVPLAAVCGKTLEQIERLLAISEHEFTEFQQWKESQKQQTDLPDNNYRSQEEQNRRKQKIAEKALSTPEKEKSVRLRTETNGYSEAQDDARRYLREHYEENDILICQICKKEQPVKVNGEYIFDARDYVSGINGFHEANNLCLCPNHSRMFYEARLRPEILRVAIINAKADADKKERKIRLDLGGNFVEVYFTQKHLADLQGVLAVVLDNDAVL